MKSTSERRVMISAGEASGDLHAAGLIRAMKGREPSLQFFGMGGAGMEAEGTDILVSADRLSVMGIVEIFGRLLTILSALRLLKTAMSERKPDLLVLVDFADFNLRLAKAAGKLGIPVYYYITPKVWVWRHCRAKLLARYVDKAGVILPFEEEYLRTHGVDATYVGNPVTDSARARFDKEAFCQKYSLDPHKALVGLLPGSRRKEVSSLLPVFLEAAKRMKKKYSCEPVFLVPIASTLTAEDLENMGLAQYRDALDIHLFADDRYEMMAACDGVIAASGTVTLELALLDVPMVVAYKLAPVTHFIAKAFIHLPFFSLVNILAGKEVVTELLQDQVKPATVELELARVLFDQDVRAYMHDEFAAIRRQLGNTDVSENSADLAFAVMEKAE